MGLSRYTDHAPAATPRGFAETLILKGKRYFGKQSLEDWARTKGIPFRFYSCDNPDAYAQWLRQLQPDLLITCGAPILPESVFAVPRLKTINIHFSLLPKYRGGSPLLWQVVDGETRGGVSIHFIDAGIDTGPIIHQAPLELPPGVSEHQLTRLADTLAAKILPAVLERLCGGMIQATMQPGKGVLPFANNIKEKSLLEFIDWEHWPIEKIWRVLRFMEYWPAARGIPAGWQRFFRWRVGRIHSATPCLDSKKWRIRPKGRLLLLQSVRGAIELTATIHPPTLLRGALA